MSSDLSPDSKRDVGNAWESMMHILEGIAAAKGLRVLIISNEITQVAAIGFFVS